MLKAQGPLTKVAPSPARPGGSGCNPLTSCRFLLLPSPPLATPAHTEVWGRGWKEKLVLYKCVYMINVHVYIYIFVFLFFSFSRFSDNGSVCTKRSNVEKTTGARLEGRAVEKKICIEIKVETAISMQIPGGVHNPLPHHPEA